MGKAASYYHLQTTRSLVESEGEFPIRGAGSNAVWGLLFFVPPLHAFEALDHAVRTLVYPQL